MINNCNGVYTLEDGGVFDVVPFPVHQGRLPLGEDSVFSSNPSAPDCCPTAVVHLTRRLARRMSVEDEEVCSRCFPFFGKSAKIVYQ
jgi:hypothetical protein